MNLVDRMLRRHPSERPQSAGDVAKALAPFCDNHHLHELLVNGQRRRDERRTRRTAQQKEAAPVEASRIGRGVQRESRSVVAQPAAAVSSGGGFIRRLLLVCAGFAGAAALAGIIWLQTDRGTLRIESATQQVPVEIRQGKNVVESLTLFAGSNEVKLASGKYEIVLPVEYDDLIVTNGSVEIRRGESWIARITETTKREATASNDDAPPNADSPSELTYEGKTFDAWKRIVLTERSPEELTRAVRALCSLGHNNRDEEATEAVLTVIERMDVKMHQAYPVAPHPESLRTKPETLLLLTAIDQLRVLQVDDVVAAATHEVRNHNANVEYFVATYMAAQRDWRLYVYSGHYGKNEIYMRDGRPLADAFYESNDWVSLFENEFAAFSEELQVNYLRFLTSSSSDGTSTVPLTSKQQAIAAAAANGEYGPHVADAACELLVWRQPTANVVKAVIDLLANTSAEDALFSNAEQHARGRSGWPLAGSWARRDFFRWTLLRELSDHIESIAVLTDWIAEDGVSFGRLALERQEVTGRFPVDPGVNFVRAGTEVGGSGITRATLAAEILALLGPRAESALSLVTKKIAAICGQQPSSDGEWGYVSGRDSTLIPTMKDVLAGQTGSVGFASEDDIQINELDSLLFAVQKITGQPVRFEEPPELLSSHAEIFPLAGLRGRTWQQWLDFATAEEAITPDDFQLAGRCLFEFYNALPITSDSTQQKNRAMAQLAVRAVRTPAADLSEDELENLWSLIELFKSHSPDQYEDLLADLLEATNDPAWHARIIGRFVAVSLPVVEPVDDDFRHLGVRGFALGEGLDFTGDSVLRLPSVLERMCRNFNEASKPAADALLNCVSIYLYNDAGGRLRTAVLNEGDSHQRIRAAGLLLRSDEARATAIDVLLTAVLSAASQVDMINAGVSLLAMRGAEHWRPEDVRRIVDYLNAAGQKRQTLVGVAVPREMTRLRWRDAPFLSSPRSLHLQVSRRILLLTLLGQADVDVLRDLTGEIKKIGKAHVSVDDESQLRARFAGLFSWDELRQPPFEVVKVREVDDGDEAALFNAHLKTVLSRLE